MKKFRRAAMKYLYCIALLPMLMLPMGHAMGDSEPVSVRSDKRGLIDVITGLAEIKTFRKNAQEIDALVSRYCKKMRERKSENGVYADYVCEASSGLRAVDYDTAEGANRPAYVMYIHVEFSYADYPEIKRLLAKKLGKANRNWKDYIGWEYKTDQVLYEQGTPAIYISRDKLDASATFGVALEQGEGER
jgi:hypothetical protein